MQASAEYSGVENASLPVMYRVTARRRESFDTITLTVAQAKGEPTPAFEPGQFNMVYAPGVGEIPISISGSPSQRESFDHTIRSVGRVTAALTAMHTGQWVGLRGPYGTPWPVEEAHGENIVFIAGGIGLAPLRPAIRHVLKNRDEFGNVTLAYGARTPHDLLYTREIERWRSRFDFDVFVTVDAADAHWRGHVGVVTELLRMAGVNASSMAFVCGPSVMMQFTARELGHLGLGSDRVYVSLERNMQCGCGQCGHCQLERYFVCKDGPVFPYKTIGHLLSAREL